MSYLLDTNVLSELVKPKPNSSVLRWFDFTPDEGLYVSVLTLGEIRKGVEKIADIKRKEMLRVWLESKIPEWFEDRILTIDRCVADRWGRLLQEMHRPIPVIDSLLTATALYYDLRLVTRNIQDFNYPSLEVVNPWG